MKNQEKDNQYWIKTSVSINAVNNSTKKYRIVFIFLLITFQNTINYELLKENGQNKTAKKSLPLAEITSRCQIY